MTRLSVKYYIYLKERNSMVKISVIVPIYNVEQYLERCLLSIKNQIFSAGAYEVILVDDGSTDKSGRLCDELMKNILILLNHYHKKMKDFL